FARTRRQQPLAELPVRVRPHLVGEALERRLLAGGEQRIDAAWLDIGGTAPDRASRVRGVDDVRLIAERSELLAQAGRRIAVPAESVGIRLQDDQCRGLRASQSAAQALERERLVP